MSQAIGHKTVTTRKKHVCFGCGREFKPGSKMERSFVVDDKPWTCYLCETCITVSQDLEWYDEYGFSDLREAALELERQKGERDG